VATLKDVARLAGVSVTTASHALNGTRHVQPETAEKVFSAVKELGYSLNSVARGLRTRSSRTIGVIGPSARDPFFAEAVSGIEDVCFARGYEVYSGYAEYPRNTGPVLISPTERDFLRTVMSGRFDAPPPGDRGPAAQWEKEEVLIAHMLAREVDGLILNLWRPDQVLVNALRGVPAKFTLFHRHIHGLDCDVFGSDDYGGTAQVLQQLLALGHRRIGMIYGTSNSGHGARNRFRAYRDVLQSAGIPIDLGLLLNGGYLPLQVAADATTRLLALPDPPTAILYWADQMAVAGLDAARRAGRSVPADLSIVGFDDHQVYAYTWPRLSTVHQDKLEAGAAMAARLIDRIEGKYDGPPEHVISPMNYVARDSVGPAPGRGS
jgi:LacI family transcriptional regulator